MELSDTDDLIDYAHNGGSLLVIGSKAVPLFMKYFDPPPDVNQASVILPVGTGKVGFIPQDLGLPYAASQSEETRQMLGSVVKQLFPNPKVEVTGSPWVDVSVSNLGEKLTVHLVNTSGNHRDLPIVEKIDPIGPLNVTIRLDEKPMKITLQPEGKECQFTYTDGKASLTVNSVPIYSILIVE